MDSTDQQPRLCATCQNFYGGPATNFLCSSCFKKSAVVMPVASEPEAVLSEVANEKSSLEEAKESKVQVRLLVTLD